ncbi:restriction endonuclease [Bacteroidales bacterium 6E]|nr:restriction endonuclease [Bacteroidales bacterium 6E]
MKFKFDANQPYQIDAINAVIDIFKGQPINKGDYEIRFERAGEGLYASQKLTELGVGNNLFVDDNKVIENTKSIQKTNNIHQPHSIQSKGKNFAIEMETGTGKTYVYLRTAFELNEKYGFKKFIIVVPSVAIREGVLKSIELMKDHFMQLYNNAPFNYFVYDSKRVSELRGFAIGNEMQLMIINIDSFNKATNNVIHQPNDRMSGRRPIEFIQHTNPIVIMDEPQNMESQKAKESINSLKPLCTLRYSATHRDKYNLLYSLDPVKAFQLRLVKKISVASVLNDNDPNAAFVKLNSVTNKAGRITCNISLHKQTDEGPKEIKITCKQDDDLYIKSNEREIYRNGFEIIEINSRPGMEFVRFANGIRLALGQETGGTRKEVVKEQIRATIKNHFEKELQVKGMGLKVLSLFFIDRVDNYRIHKDGGYDLGKYGLWFEEIYKEVGQEYTMWLDILPVHKVHNGYFSKDKKGNLKDTSGDTADDADTYSLIMKDKERLLNLDEPLKFIFSHSALREGWDNPNVFQICTLNETRSTLKKRQEIGRGLRLPVNQNGERIFDKNINNLVVIANESYQDFASSLQKEFQEDCGVVFGRLPVDAFIDMKFAIDGEEKKIDRMESERIWEHLRDNFWIAGDGFITKTFGEAVDNRELTLPEGAHLNLNELIQRVEEFQLENHIEDHNRKKKIKLNEKVLLDPEFEKFWNAINSKTIYSVKYSTEEMIHNAVKALMKMDRIKPAQIRTMTADLEVKERGVSTQLIHIGTSVYAEKAKRVPDILTYIQSKTELTRSTIYEILVCSKRLNEFPINPQQFMDSVVKEIKDVMNRIIVEGIQYEKLEGIQYEMSKFYEEEHKLFFDEEKITPTNKSVYDYILWDSKVEQRFAKDLEANIKVKYYIKLPGWFTIDTPVGTYNPDWAILKQNGDVVYMIRETKSTKDQLKLRISESDKIHCGRQHFMTIGVDYDVATTIEDSGL